MTGPRSWAILTAEEERYRPLYARLLGLRFVNPGGVLCFVFFEGAVALAALLALAELVSWWSVLVLPTMVAVMVKINDVVAARVVRSAALVPDQERDRFRHQMEPVVGTARVGWNWHSVPGVVVSSAPERPGELASAGARELSSAAAGSSPRPERPRPTADLGDTTAAPGHRRSVRRAAQNPGPDRTRGLVLNWYGWVRRRTTPRAWR
ncbi:hypothetical protein [Salinispora pacifica]|uniref:hypothetical protein n=1 Tax=Salinispora pacifica TaxID=351187 RepID=UPI0003F57F46|nr:hypothetical protein [Salinispora pacifica]